MKTINNLALQFQSEDEKKALSCIFGLRIFHGVNLGPQDNPEPFKTPKTETYGQYKEEKEDDDFYDFSDEEITPPPKPKQQTIKQPYYNPLNKVRGPNSRN